MTPARHARRWPWSSIAVLLVTGCGDAAITGPDAPDVDARLGTLDATDGPTCTVPGTPDCPCSTAGETICSGTFGVSCCSGRWRAFGGDPCARGHDAGMPTCSGTELGCACTEEGATACRMVSEWRLRCSSGIWREDIGFVCC